MKILRKFLVFVAALAAFSPAFAAYAVVQQIDASVTSGGTCTTASFGASITAGNLIWFVGVAPNAATPNAPTRGSDSYTLISSVAGSSSTAYQYYAKNVGSGTTAIAWSMASGTGDIDCYGVEVSGLDTSSPLLGNNELASNPGGASDSVVSGTASVTTTGAIVLGFDMELSSRTHNNPGDEGTGFTPLSNVFGSSGNGRGMPEHKRVTSSSSYQATFDDPGFNNHLALMAIFAEAGAGGTCTHDGWKTDGSFATPTAGSGNYWLKSGAMSTTDCSSTQYWQKSGAFGAN